MAADKAIFLVAQLDPANEDPTREDLYDIGTIATVLQLLKLPDGTVKVLVEGRHRAQIETLDGSGGYLTADVTMVDDQEASGAEAQALIDRKSTRLNSSH